MEAVPVKAAKTQKKMKEKGIKLSKRFWKGIQRHFARRKRVFLKLRKGRRGVPAKSQGV